MIKAIQKGKEKTGIYPVGILIDNRLTNDEKTQVKEFCKDHDIVVVNTFPGNSKSNGIIEGNFSIFEKQVGDIYINGTTPEEIAGSVSKNIVEIFTQLRNNKGRRRLQNKTPEESSIEAVRPEHQRSQLERLRDRLQKEEDRSEKKFMLLQDIFSYFESFDEESTAKFKKIVSRYSDKEIIAAKAAYLVQSFKHPNKLYRSEYFLAILRNIREEQAKRIYNESYRATYKSMLEIQLGSEKSTEELKMKLLEFIKQAQTQSPSHMLMSLETLCFTLTDFVKCGRLPKLWVELAAAVQACHAISQRCWAKINEFVHDKIGDLLYSRPSAGENPHIAEAFAAQTH